MDETNTGMSLIVFSVLMMEAVLWRKVGIRVQLHAVLQSRRSMWVSSVPWETLISLTGVAEETHDSCVHVVSAEFSKMNERKKGGKRREYGKVRNILLTFQLPGQSYKASQKFLVTDYESDNRKTCLCEQVSCLRRGGMRMAEVRRRWGMRRSQLSNDQQISQTGLATPHPTNIYPH